MLSSKDRMSIPLAPRRRLAWLGNGSLRVLAVLEANGSAEIMPWEGIGTDRIAHLERALNRLAEPDRSEVALAAMDRYLQLHLDEAGRTVLPTTLLSHLDAVGTSTVRLVVSNGRLWLWSEQRWRLAQLDRYLLLARSLEETNRPLGAP